MGQVTPSHKHTDCEHDEREKAADHRPPDHHRTAVCPLDPVDDFIGFRAGQSYVRLERISNGAQMVVELLSNQLAGAALHLSHALFEFFEFEPNALTDLIRTLLEDKPVQGDDRQGRISIVNVNTVLRYQFRNERPGIQNVRHGGQPLRVSARAVRTGPGGRCGAVIAGPA